MHCIYKVLSTIPFHVVHGFFCTLQITECTELHRRASSLCMYVATYHLTHISLGSFTTSTACNKKQRDGGVRQKETLTSSRNG